MVLFFAFALSVSAAQADNNRCEERVGSVLTAEGQVSLKSHQTNQWIPVSADYELCAGDIIRSLSNSKASLLLDYQDTIVRLKENTSLALPVDNTKDPFWVKLFEGALNFLSRTSQSLAVRPPFVNATVEGTEFLVSVDSNKQETIVSVLEGQVNVANDLGNLKLNNGQSAVAVKGEAPALRLDITPENAVRWSLYFPKIQSSAVKQTEIFEEVYELIANGEMQSALQQLDNIQIPDMQSDAHALKSIIYLKLNNLEQAQVEAETALQQQPITPAAYLANSKVKQAAFELSEALVYIDELLTRWPDDEVAIIQKIELLLAQGNYKAATTEINSAKQSFSTQPRFQVVSGFAYLISGDNRLAESAFNQAKNLDASDPMAFLGAGLIKIKQGELASGRRLLETAVSLEPTQSLLRSYLAKAYFEESRYQAT